MTSTTNTLTATTHPSNDDSATTARPFEQQRRREPIWRVVGGSLAAGLIGAVVLTLGVFGGATEPVISGSALLAFAGGWALLAMLSSRFTSQPQTWARVPAIAMAVAGVALIVTSPGDRVLNAVRMGLVAGRCSHSSAWMIVQLRRSLHGRVRGPIYAVVAVMVVCSVGGMYATVGRSQDAHSYPAPGRLYDVGGHRLHLDCVGSAARPSCWRTVSADCLRCGVVSAAR